MHDIVIRPEAAADIETIADYTIDQWGVEQARHYVEDIRRIIERLAINGLRQPEQPNVFPNLRKIRSGHHLIFYLIDDRQVEVIRVLHERQNLTRQLRS